VTWRDEACPVIDPEKKEQMVESMPPSLQVVVESMKRRAEDKNTGEAARTAGFEELRKRMGDKEVQEWMAAVAKAAEPDPRFVAGFETVTRVCLEEGWLEEPQGETVPYAVRAVSLRRGDICRAFVLSSMMGVSSISMTQEQAKSADSA
jgi:hypothetical protein